MSSSRRGPYVPRTKINSSVKQLTDELKKEYNSKTIPATTRTIVQPSINSIHIPTPVQTIAEQIPIPIEEVVAEQIPKPPELAAEQVPKLATKKRTVQRPKPPSSIAQETMSEISKRITGEYKFQQHVDRLTDPYKLDTKLYTTPSRRSFYKFIRDTYQSTFGLPFKEEVSAIDEEACSKLGITGDQKAKIFLYQEFIREYIRQASPYRGVLVYHGLGSGKTCSAIASLESLYGMNHKKIIVMTPFSLRQNFINEIMFCGFRHYQLNNYWNPITIPTDQQAIYKLFAKEELSLSDSFIKNINTLWIPNLSSTAPPPNYKSLSVSHQKEIREQLQNTIQNRMHFINYNGITAEKLKEIACTRIDGKGLFDDSVIVIDEFHNMVRLMQGTIVPYMVSRKGRKRKIEPEPVTPGIWKPKLCDSPNNYKRAFLFYRLLCGAKNSKIIALSGTPIINFPEELAIISNVICGYIDCVEVSVMTSSISEVNKFINIAQDEPRVDIVRPQPGTGQYKILISFFQQGYEKKTRGGEILGIEHHPESMDDIKTIYQRIKQKAIAAKIPIKEEIYKSYPRLPPDGETFRRNFINQETSEIKNTIVLKKRLAGFISYYKGSKEEYMPRIIRDEIVACPMSDYVLSKYIEARNQEIKGEKSKKDGDSGDVFADVEFFSKRKNPSSYRFRSRAICNFAFPKEIKRPYPEDEKELEGEASGIEQIEGVDGDEEMISEEDKKVAINIQETEQLISEPEEQEEVEPQPLMSIIGDAIGVGDLGVSGVSGVPRTYHQLIMNALNSLNTLRDKYLRLNTDNSGVPSLMMYSPKMAQILINIQRSKGSNMIYSQFKTVEGLGVFGIALKANGFVEIVIDGGDENPYFSPETEASLRKGPSSGEKRFMFLTGEGSRERRSLILNIFNGNFDKLSPRISSVLIEAGYEAEKNKEGGLCWVFGITSAGAEGISLKNVRMVHIMEPYWNKVRTDQVKGRAVRICSHADLLFEERNVEIYTYYSSFTPEQIATDNKIDKTITLADGTETSEQKILNLSIKKEKINLELLDIMKKSSVDCMLNMPDNDITECFFIDGTSGQYMFDPDLDIDILQTSEDYAKEEGDEIQEIDKVVEETGKSTGKPGFKKLSKIEISEEDETNPRQYVLNPVGTNKYQLFDTKDIQLLNPIGEISTSILTGEFEDPVFY